MTINIPTAHKANVVLPYGGLTPVVEWCDRNCTGEWRYMDILNGDDSDAGRWEFLFESERDYVAFLMWKK